MNKIGIVYFSYHHGNTKKVVDAMKEECELDLISATEVKNFDLSKYDFLGFASGIYKFNFSPIIRKIIQNTEFTENQKVFLVYTCCFDMGYYKKVKKLFKDKKCQYIGKFGCNGYNTFGPFKLVGGTGKNRPNKKDFENAKKFIKEIQTL